MTSIRLRTVLMAISVLLFISVFIPVGQVFASQPVLTYKSQFGSEGSDPGQFRWPYGIATSPDGSKLYVTDPYSNRIQIISTADYSYLGDFPTDYQPYGLAVNPDGSKLYVTLGFGSLEVINTADGTRDALFGSNDCSGWDNTPDGELCAAGGVVVSPDGTKYYVADGNDHVQVFNTSDNSFISKFGSTGSGNGEFDFGDTAFRPHLTISPNGQKLYVGDTLNNRIQVFNTSDNSFVTTFGTASNVCPTSSIAEGTDTSGETFCHPGDLAISPDGKKLIVTDIYNNRLKVYRTTDNSFVSQVGSQGSGDQQFNFDWWGNGLAFSPDGSQVYVTDGNNHRVKIYHFTGSQNQVTNEVTNNTTGSRPDTLAETGASYVIPSVISLLACTLSALIMRARRQNTSKS